MTKIASMLKVPRSANKGLNSGCGYITGTGMVLCLGADVRPETIAAQEAKKACLCKVT